MTASRRPWPVRGQRDPARLRSTPRSRGVPAVLDRRCRNGGAKLPELYAGSRDCQHGSVVARAAIEASDDASRRAACSSRIRSQTGRVTRVVPLAPFSRGFVTVVRELATMGSRPAAPGTIIEVAMTAKEQLLREVRDWSEHYAEIALRAVKREHAGDAVDEWVTSTRRLTPLRHG
jgi:hypothetical protein